MCSNSATKKIIALNRPSILTPAHLGPDGNTQREAWATQNKKTHFNYYFISQGLGKCIPVIYI